jgi:hypothetical protein
MAASLSRRKSRRDGACKAYATVDRGIFRARARARLLQARTAGLKDEMTTMGSFRFMFFGLLTAGVLHGQAIKAQDDDDDEDRGGRNSICSATTGRDRVNGTLNVVGRCTLTGTDVRGDVVLFAGGSLIARGIRIRGSLSGDRADFVELHDVRVDRGVDLRDLVGDSSTIEGSEIRGDIMLTGNRSRFEIVANELRRGLTLLGNTGGLQIAGNSIDGDLSCSGNAPAPTLLGNRIEGDAEGQCAPSRPARTPSPTPTPTPVTPPPSTAPPPSTPTTPKTPTPSPPPTTSAPPPTTSTPPPTTAPPAPAEPPATTAPPATPAPGAAPAPAPAADATLLDDGGAGAFGWPMIALLLPLVAWRRGRRRCA